MKNKKVVVTGGAGFIGSNLSGELSMDNEISIIDNFLTGKKENILELIEKDNVKLIEGSITDLDFLQKAFKNIDYVFHQAAVPSVPRSVEDPISSNDVNINGTLNVLIAARDNDVKKVVYASSSAVYGDTPTLPKAEKMCPMPLSPYAVTKLAGEIYCKVFYEIYGLPTISLRYFNVYGPRQDPASQYAAVIPKFIYQIMNNTSLSIYGDGEQSRDFTFVYDVVQANIKAATSNAAGEIINIAKGERTTINTLAEIIMEISGKNLEPLHIEPMRGDIRYSLADISKAMKLIGYNPKYSLKSGLEETINYFIN